MVNKLIQNIPLSDAYKSPRDTDTKAEVNALIAAAVSEARAIDEASMAKHNRDATVISMILGFTVLALFIDGLLRILGIIPPFMDIDVNVIDNITEQVKSELLPLVSKLPKL